jgi:hypothetical protein
VGAWATVTRGRPGARPVCSAKLVCRQAAGFDPHGPPADRPTRMVRAARAARRRSCDPDPPGRAWVLEAAPGLGIGLGRAAASLMAEA